MAALVCNLGESPLFKWSVVVSALCRSAACLENAFKMVCRSISLSRSYSPTSEGELPLRSNPTTTTITSAGVCEENSPRGWKRGSWGKEERELHVCTSQRASSHTPASLTALMGGATSVFEEVTGDGFKQISVPPQRCGILNPKTTINTKTCCRTGASQMSSQAAGEISETFLAHWGQICVSCGRHAPWQWMRYQILETSSWESRKVSTFSHMKRIFTAQLTKPFFSSDKCFLTW